jgi:hypothetical protein
LDFIAEVLMRMQGLMYLQNSAMHTHGNLKTTNCLVDQRWTVKICDFGLWNLRVQIYDDRVSSDLEALYKGEIA